jgi:hypothetical protein
VIHQGSGLNQTRRIVNDIDAGEMPGEEDALESEGVMINTKGKNRHMETVNQGAF